MNTKIDLNNLMISLVPFGIFMGYFDDLGYDIFFETIALTLSAFLASYICMKVLETENYYEIK